MRIRNFVEHITYISIILIMSYFVVKPFIGNQFIVGGGESGQNIAPGIVMNGYSTWQNRVNFGGFSPQQTNVLLYSYIWPLFEKTSLGTHPSIVFTFLVFSVSALVMYFVLIALGTKNYLIAFIGALVYAFNPFRYISVQNHVLHLMFILLPLFFYFYYKFITTFKINWLILLTFVSYLSSSLGSNLARFVVPYLLIFIMFTSAMLAETNNLKRKKIFFGTIIFILFTVIINLFWLYPTYIYLYSVFVTTKVNLDLTSALTGGSLYDHLRFIGWWSWKERGFVTYYFPFHTEYYSNVLLAYVGYLPLLTISYVFHKFEILKANITIKKLSVLLFFIYVVSILISAGVKGPFSLIYEEAYNKIPFFVLFREPFAKFTPLMVFSAAALYSICLTLIKSKVPKVIFIYTVIVSIIAIAVYYEPFVSEKLFVTRRWDNGNNPTVQKVPEYWFEASNYFKTIDDDYNTLLYPRFKYVTLHNSPYGFHIAGTLADFLFNKPIVRAFNVDNTEAGNLLSSIVSYSNNKDFHFESILGYLSIARVLQVRDQEWRYSDAIPEPSEVDRILNQHNLDKIKDFGMYTTSYLESIPNDEQNADLRDSFYTELHNKAPLTLFSVDHEYLNPIFFAAKDVIYSSGDSRDLPKFFMNDELLKDSIVIFSEDSKAQANEIVTKSSNVIITPQIYKSDFDPNDIYWDLSFSWPEANAEPGTFKYKLVRLFEKIKLIKAGETGNNLQIRSWYLAKRLVEMDKYPKHKNTVFNYYVEELNGLLEFYEKSESKLKNDVSSLNFFNKYLHKSIIELSKLELSEFQQSQVILLYDKYRSIFNSNAYCGRICSILNVPKIGTYQKYQAGKLVGSLYFDSVGLKNFPIDESLLREKKLLNIESGVNLHTNFYKIESLSPNNYYFITMSFPVNTNPIDLKIDSPTGKFFRKNITISDLNSQEKINSKLLSNSKYCDTNNSGTCYSRYDLVFQVDIPYDYLILNISSNNEYVEIKDLSVSELPSDQIQLRMRNGDSLSQSNTPLVNYKKLNTTEYLLDIPNPADRFIIVFNQNYDEAWYLHSDQFDNTEVTLKHFRANGFANAWYVEIPSDRLTDVLKLKLVFKQQAVENFLVTLTVLTLAVLIIFFVVLSVYEIRTRETRKSSRQ